jgi:catechol 2,3-dioxygenase-like lactoylglutathione lyase family enzyme
MPLCQIALSTIDLARSHAWYRRVLGLLPAAGPRHAEGEMYARVPGLPEASFDVWWHVDAQPWFQLEMFQFQRPPMKRLRPDHRRSDLGYAAIGVHVFDFDAALQRLEADRTAIETTVGEPGDRRIVIRDPDGVLLELVERDVRPPSPRKWPTAGASICSITLSVPDLDGARRFWETLGLAPADHIRLHGPEHEALWALHEPPKRSALVRSGEVVLELVEYANPRPRPEDYLLSDQGILNVALGSTTKAEFDAVYERAIRAGYRGNTDPWTVPGLATVVYLNDDRGISVELLHVESPERMGFEPVPC